ncbi:MAG: MerR family transcriptional regulator [Burkholderiales bacterium]|nr:MerR family transcriptional regulator [Burkholderiales bacterium]
MNATLTIQEAAAATGLTAHTLRYYERIGLLDPIPRHDNQRRVYRTDDLRWINFLIKLRTTGMPIRMMLRYAALRRAGDTPDSLAERRAMLEAQAAEVSRQMDDLSATLAVLQMKVALYAEKERTYATSIQQQASRRST